MSQSHAVPIVEKKPLIVRISLRILSNLLILLAGAVLVFSFAPAYKGMLALVWPAVLILACRHDTSWRAFRRAWLFNFGFFLSAVYWVWFSMHVFYGIPSPLSMAVVALFGAFLAVFPALAVALSVRMGVNKNAVVMLAIFPVLWIFLEWTRGWFMTGFPWVAVGYSQTDTLLASMGPVLGIYGIGWIVMLLATTIAILVKHTLNLKPVIWYAGMLLFVISALFNWVIVCWLLLMLVAGYALYQKQWLVLPVTLLVLTCIPLASIEWSDPQGKTLKVSLVQGNIYQAVKWESKNVSLSSYLGLSLPLWDSNKKTGAFNPELIVWPETALPFVNPKTVKKLISKIQRRVVEHGSELITGIVFRSYKEIDGKLTILDYNSVLKIGKELERYNKYHLVPYGEYIPLERTLGWLYSFLGTELSVFTRGEMPQNLLTVRGMPVAVNICYETAFPEEIILGLPRAAFLVNLSNNAWFYNPIQFADKSRIPTKALMQNYPATGLTALYKQWVNDSIEAYQVLQIAQMRAIETSRYMLSATNDGVTAIINHKGKIVSALPRFRPGSLNGEIQPMQGATLFVRVGNYLILGIMLFSLLAGLWLSRRLKNT
ncbi:Apolipoprotein N-acyltransferase / Copper homeostasis protein CutE [hydrothermal vent metagenome]|uniref:Apolipoprotein N-acyltransferase / Copper homeostasis protein CutE n=1 Tax=hydrothermal vent metagenome TaxID=652676 RepID=A0A3B0Y6Y5_9ZZZZ